MGLLISLTTTIMDHVDKVKADQRKDRLEEEQKKKDNILKPIAPPKYYSTIEARRKNVKDGPYTVEAIAASLRNDLIPVGYSLEQLQKIGFGADVREYERRRKERQETNKKDLIEGLEKLKKEIEKGFTSEENLSQEDKDLIKKYDIFNPVQRAKYITKFNRWIELAKQDVLGEDVLDNMVSVFNLRIGDYQDALKQEAIKKQNEEIVDNAVLNRDRKVLLSVRRALANGYGINRF